MGGRRMNRRLNQKGSVLILSLLLLTLFLVMSPAILRLYVMDTKHEVAGNRYDQSYFLSEGAKQRAEHYFRYEAPYRHDGNAANDPASITLNIDGVIITIDIGDTYQQ